MEYDADKNGIVEDNELVKAIQDWLAGKIDDNELLKLIMMWLNPELKPPEDWQPREISSRELYESGAKRIHFTDSRYMTTRPEILLNQLKSESFADYDDFQATITAMGTLHYKDREVAKGAFFIACWNGKWYLACFDGEKWWLIDVGERRFWECIYIHDVWLIG